MPETKTKNDDAEVVDETTEEASDIKDEKKTKTEKGKAKSKSKKAEESEGDENEDKVKDVKFLQAELEASHKSRDEQFAEIIELKKKIEDLNNKRKKEDEESEDSNEKEVIDVQAEYERLVKSQAEKDKQILEYQDKIRKDNITKALEKNLSKENLSDNIPSELLIPYMIDKYRFNYNLEHDSVFYKDGNRTMVVSDALADMKAKYPKLFKQLKYRSPIINSEVGSNDDLKTKLARTHAVSRLHGSVIATTDFTPEEKKQAYNSQIRRKETK